LKFSSTSLFGVKISKMNMDETAAYAEAAIANKQPHHIITVNPIMLMEGLSNACFLQVLRTADVVIPDGAGVVWAANYLGNPVTEQVPGIDLIHRLMEIGHHKGWKVYLLGASPEVVRETARTLEKAYPGIKIVGIHDGFFTNQEEPLIFKDIRRASPDILLVGRSMHKQDPWISWNKEKLQIPIMMGVGGSFDVISGKLRRAPSLFRKLRIEWLFRLIQQPWRYRRMLALPKFMWKVMRERANGMKDQ